MLRQRQPFSCDNDTVGGKGRCVLAVCSCQSRCMLQGVSDRKATEEAEKSPEHQQNTHTLLPTSTTHTLALATSYLHWHQHHRAVRGRVEGGWGEGGGCSGNWGRGGGVGMIAGVGLGVCDENNERCPRVCFLFCFCFTPFYCSGFAGSLNNLPTHRVLSVMQSRRCVYQSGDACLGHSLNTQCTHTAAVYLTGDRFKRIHQDTRLGRITDTEYSATVSIVRHTAIDTEYSATVSMVRHTAIDTEDSGTVSMVRHTAIDTEDSGTVSMVRHTAIDTEDSGTVSMVRHTAIDTEDSGTVSIVRHRAIDTEDSGTVSIVRHRAIDTEDSGTVSMVRHTAIDTEDSGTVAMIPRHTAIDIEDSVTVSVYATTPYGYRH